MRSLYPVLRLLAAARIRWSLWGLDLMAPHLPELRIRLHELENPR